MVQNVLTAVGRGQLYRSKLKLAKRWQWSRGKLERFFSVLETEHMIVQQTRRHATLITLCNYDRLHTSAFGDRTPDGTTDRTPDGTPNGHLTDIRRDTNKKEKNVKNEKKEREACNFESEIKRWNDLAEPLQLPAIREISSQRRKHYEARISQNTDYWQVLEREIPRLGPFATGDNDRGWRMTFDFCVESQDKFNKLAEGQYRDQKAKPKRSCTNPRR